MRFKLSIFITSIFILLCGAWLYFLNNGAAAEFQRLYSGFGSEQPRLTILLFSSLSNWWSIIIAISTISYLPLFLSKTKWQYLSILSATISLGTLVLIVYLPIIDMGRIVGGS